MSEQTIRANFTPTGQSIRFNSSFANKSTDDLAEGGSSLYFTNTRCDNRIALQVGSNLDLSSKSLSELNGDTDQLVEGVSNIFYTDTRFDTRLATKTSTDIAEGSNLYYTAERCEDQINSLLVAGIGITKNYNDAGGSLTIGTDLELNEITDVSITTPSGGQVLRYDGVDSWDNATLQISDLAGNSDAITEGTTQLFLKNLNISGDTGSSSVNLGTGQTLAMEGTSGEIETSVSGQTCTIGLPSTITSTITMSNLTTTNILAVSEVEATSTIKLANLTSGAISGLTPQAGQLVFNTTTNKGQIYNGTSWVDFH